jgi:hypothetical protein
MHDIDRAKFEVHLEMKRQGLHKIIDGAIDGILAMLPNPTLPDCGPIVKAIELKTWPEWFDGLWDGTKRAELRVGDRPFVVGGCLLLREYKPLRGIPEEGTYTGRWVTARITRVDSMPNPGRLMLLSLEFLSRGTGNLHTERHPCAVAPEVVERVNVSIRHD